MSELPSNAIIRQFLSETFSDEEIVTLCFDYFPDVNHKFTSVMTKTQKTLILLEYCQNHEIIPNLMAAIQRTRPAQYEKRFPQTPRFDSLPKSEESQRNPCQIFISHAYEDAGFAHRLANDLKNQGWRVWIAPDNIRPGEKWMDALNRGLSESGVYIVVLTPDAVDSKWVHDETNVAIMLKKEDGIHFIPLHLKSCNVPLLWKLYQQIGFDGLYEDGLRELLSELDRHNQALLAKVKVQTSIPVQAEPLQPHLGQKPISVPDTRSSALSKPKQAFSLLDRVKRLGTQISNLPKLIWVPLLTLVVLGIVVVIGLRDMRLSSAVPPLSSTPTETPSLSTIHPVVSPSSSPTPTPTPALEPSATVTSMPTSEPTPTSIPTATSLPASGQNSQTLKCQSDNLLVNGDFGTNSVSPWNLSGTAGSKRNVVIDASSSNPMAKVSQNGPDLGAYVELKQVIQPPKGGVYLLSALCRISGTPQYVVHLEAFYNDSTKEKFLKSESFFPAQLSTSSMVPVSLHFEVPSEAVSIRIGLGFSGIGDVWFDDIKLCLTD